MNSIHSLRPLRYRTVWISDVHLGSKACCAAYLLDFLESIQCEKLYLVGDIIDMWALKRSIYWPQAHNDIVRAIELLHWADEKHTIKGTGIGFSTASQAA